VAWPSLTGECAENPDKIGTAGFAVSAVSYDVKCDTSQSITEQKEPA
jgi:hypothetical protein